MQAQRDFGDGPGDFAGDKGLAPQWAFVVEENAVRSMNPISFTVILDDPKAVKFGHAIWTAGIEWGGL